MRTGKRMNCSRVQAALSASMDGDVRSMTADMREHASTCTACGRFADGAQRLRVGARLRIAEPVPDLVGQIMARVREESSPTQLPLRPRRRPISVRSLVAAALAGALIGAVAVSGGLLPSNRPDALAASIPHRIAEAARNLQAYQASYRIVERNWNPAVPKRTFDVEVAFAATEQFRVDVTDTTRYPAGGGSWQPNDSSLVVDGSRWSLEGPDVCIPAVTTPCPPPGSASVSPAAGAPVFHQLISGRPPFDADAPMPTDIILPVTTLAGSDRVDVIGQGTVAGRPAVEVSLSAQDAQPLFAFFQEAGSWRSLHPSDRVELWLDRESWFPLSYRVTAAPGQDRATWAARSGIEQESAGDEVLEVTLVSLSERPPLPGLFHAQGRGTDEGFREAKGSALADAAGFEPVVPLRLQGLQPGRSGTFAGAPGEAVLSYADGLSWVRVRETRSWAGPSLFGNVDAFAQRVELPDGAGTAYFEPASAQSGRRVAIHAAGIDVFLESNLPRDQLLALAASMPVHGLDIPDELRTQHLAGGVVLERLGLSELERRADFPVLVPATVPAGYRLSAAQLALYHPGTGATLYFSRDGTELGGFGIRIYQSPGESIPPASGTALSQIEVRGVPGRWSPDQHQLEWVESDGVYRSISAPGLELGRIVGLAESMQEPGAP